MSLQELASGLVAGALFLASCGSARRLTSTPAGPATAANRNPPAQSSLAAPPTGTPVVVTPVPPGPLGPFFIATAAGGAFPGEPGQAVGFIVDRASASFAASRRTIADDYASLRFERPFSRTRMEYLPFVDILRSEVVVDERWVYVSIFLDGAAPPERPVMYAVELDEDGDGRGDWLIAAFSPLGPTWSHGRVQVRHDADGDVGGAVPLTSEGPRLQGNGYEAIAFESGGQDSDNPAWARAPAGPPPRIQFALRLDWPGEEVGFLWGVWADAGFMDPGWFDYHDRFSLREAGSPLASSPDYPLKLLSAVDNTCRWTFGFAPTGGEPGLCGFEPPTPIPSVTATATAPSP